MKEETVEKGGKTWKVVERKVVERSAVERIANELSKKIRTRIMLVLNDL